jgi:HD-GYP domain-containing protein (c-di-GMP phosphodiesterase class II)
VVLLLLKIKYFQDHFRVFRYLYFVLLFAAPVITNVLPQFNSLNVLTVIFLGTGFSNKPKWFLFIGCSFAVVIRAIVVDVTEFNNPTAYLTRLFVYLIVTFISSDVSKKYHEIKKQKKELILTLAKSIDSRDTFTANHSENVAKYALEISKEMRLSKEQCENIYIGGLLHDIGKIGIPESILSKPARLTESEFENIKQHPELGFEIVKYNSAFKNSGIIDMVLYHHERYDGKGYPNGLKGEGIPLAARIISVADSFDAMVSKRVYKNEMDLEYAMSEIENNKGTQFDPQIADVFLNLLQKQSDLMVHYNSLEKSS